MQRKDYYGILGVARDADENEIKSSYRRLALLNHPDTNRDDPKAEERFKEINAAYEVLSSREKRTQYDLGRDPLAIPVLRPSYFHPWSDPFEEGCFPGSRCRGGGLGRILGRKRRVSRMTAAGQTLFDTPRSDLPVHDLALTPDEALNGAERDVRLHSGLDTAQLTISIPAGVGDGKLLRFRHQGIELQFRVRVLK